MNQFTKIEGAKALFRTRSGIYRESDVYRRGTGCFLPMSGGYIRVEVRTDIGWRTSNPRVVILELEVSGLEYGKFGQPILEAE